VSHRTFALFAGPILFLLILVFFPTVLFEQVAREMAREPDQVPVLVSSMRVVLGLLVLMVVWWVTEAIPLPATALLPAVLLPWFQCYGIGPTGLTGLTFGSVLENFASPVIFLFLGGFLLSAAMRRWGLDRRLTFWLLTRGRIASDARLILLGVMVLTATLSMWISNTATAALMLPVGLAIVNKTGESGNGNFGRAMMLAIAWSASTGGMGTMIGSPPNAIAVGILDATLGATEGYRGMTFLGWMAFGVPFVVLFIPIIWLLLVRRYPPGGRLSDDARGRLVSEHLALGPLTAGEKRTAAVFLAAIALWISNPFWEHLLPGELAAQLSWVNEYAVGLAAGVSLFIIPVQLRKPEFLLTWEDTRFVDWGVLLLFGGGIALSDAMFSTGLAAWIARGVIGLVGAGSIWTLVIVVVLLVNLLTEVTSNTAVTTMIVPILISIALAAHVNPVTLSVAAALAASMAFMLPVATPPNALVYGAGLLRLSDMVRTGLLLDVIGWPFTIIVLWLFGSVLFGVVSF